ncbi:MAG TPA: ABC transporter ATP-binding protein [Thermoleophilaceae bacterium]|jgi:ABC-type polysaccharide/polyol phosphate transport system ATPase subunit
MSSLDTTSARSPAGVPPPERPLVIEARGVSKTFRIPQHRVDSLKERATHPFRRIEYRTLEALRDVSFDVHEGEFFGIVGRNGSGKSTLLKLMASIYQASGGRIRMAGRLAPFIELGVGFNAELTARENVVLNGVMMGLSRREAARRLDAVLDFAELREFPELPLKNYSSGMMVRLAFAVMVQADADIMLIDEVLAVGDASFAQKCVDVFHARREAGKTVVLVTHDMSSVQAFCDRAMLLHDGELRYLGEPEEAALRYYRLNFGGIDTDERPPQDGGGIPDVNARLLESWIENERGERVENVEQGQPLRLNLVLETLRDLTRPVLGFHVITGDGTRVFGFNHRVSDEVVRAGRRIRVSTEVENPLLPGRYFATVWVARDRQQGDVALQVLRLADFVVYGTQEGPGLVSTPAKVDAVVEE